MSQLIRLISFVVLSFLLDGLGAGIFTGKYWAIMTCVVAIALTTQ